mmetsp:Transcript_2698/g.6463  ORF Transcript_2698/g.6463 Transcript_2698/m.6463 type:complete len:374 (+) Transcript_2698:552-1673(+)
MVLLKTRFRPIAPKPQEGVTNKNSKEKGSALPNVPSVAVKADAKAAQSAAKKHASDKRSQQQTASNSQASTEMSLDPKDFCYPELQGPPHAPFGDAGLGPGMRPGSPFLASPCAHCNGCGFGAPYPQGAGSGYPNTIQYVGDVFDNNGNAANNNSSGKGGNPCAGASLRGMCTQDHHSNSMGGSAANVMSLFNSVSTTSTMKLDLDEGSVAKAFGDEIKSNRDRRSHKRSRESGDELQQSVGTNEVVPKDVASGSEADTIALHQDRAVCERASLNSHPGISEQCKAAEKQTKSSTSSLCRQGGFGSCIVKGSTNPLFQMDDRLACSFIAEFLHEKPSPIGCCAEHSMVKNTIKSLERRASSAAVESLAKKQKA